MVLQSFIFFFIALNEDGDNEKECSRTGKDVIYDYHQEHTNAEKERYSLQNIRASQLLACHLLKFFTFFC